MTEVGIAVSTEDCIEWDGYLNNRGYGRRSVGGISGYVHRFAWEEEHGPIPEGAHVLHRCDNPPCFNVDHLFLGSALENSRDMVAKGRQWRQKRTHCDYGHILSGDNLVPGKRTRLCLTCQRASQRKNAREYYRRNRDAVLKRAENYRDANKEKMAAKRRAVRAADPEKFNARNRAWRARQREKAK